MGGAADPASDSDTDEEKEEHEHQGKEVEDTTFVSCRCPFGVNCAIPSHLHNARKSGYGRRKAAERKKLDAKAKSEGIPIPEKRSDKPPRYYMCTAAGSCKELDCHFHRVDTPRLTKADVERMWEEDRAIDGVDIKFDGRDTKAPPLVEDSSSEEPTSDYTDALSSDSEEESESEECPPLIPQSEDKHDPALVAPVAAKAETEIQISGVKRVAETRSFKPGFVIGQPKPDRAVDEAEDVYCVSDGDSVYTDGDENNYPCYEEWGEIKESKFVTFLEKFSISRRCCDELGEKIGVEELTDKTLSYWWVAVPGGFALKIGYHGAYAGYECARNIVLNSYGPRARFDFDGESEFQMRADLIGETEIETKSVVVFEEHDTVDDNRFYSMRYRIKSWFAKNSPLAQRNALAIKNQAGEHCLSSVVERDSAESESISWIWTRPNEEDLERTRKTYLVDLLAGKYKTATLLPVYTEFVAHALTSELLMERQALDPAGQRTHPNVSLAVGQLLSNYKDKDEMRKNPGIVINTEIHISNQILIRGLRLQAAKASESEMSRAREAAPPLFLRGVLSEMQSPGGIPSK